MIHAKELRIGNIVNEFGLPIKIDARILLKLSEIEVKDKICIDLSYIPLTEEWLLKFGFVWSIQHQAHYLKGFDYVIDVCNGFCRVIKYKRNGDHLIDVKYLHELQNLYWCLTGEELIIK
jgi:hypothetical protein